MTKVTITSLQHSFVKYCVKLRKDRGLRRQEGLVLVTGSILIKELDQKGVKIDTLITEESSPFSCKAKHHMTVSSEVMHKIAGGKEEVAALIPLPTFQDLSSCSYLLILDQISDPGNLGTLMRTAYSLGWDGVFLVDGTCDPFSEKALRAAKGASFLLPIQEGSWELLCQLASSFTVLTADMGGAPLKQGFARPPLGLILSKESKGARKEAKKMFQAISIPMHDEAESLNVAAAGAILLYTLKGS
jgi:TrmH family RNA methyltransferase